MHQRPSPGQTRHEGAGEHGDPALAAWLGPLQEASFNRASGAVRKAHPPERRMIGPQLAGYLARRTYALESSTRRDTLGGLDQIPSNPMPPQ